MASASDVPSKFDVVINGQGYTFFRPLDGSYLTSGRHHAEYGYTSTFIERQNVQGNYGDNQQDFWLTASQNDWSLGEDQRFFSANDASKSRRYWVGTNTDVSQEGQVALQPSPTTATFATTTQTGAIAVSSSAATEAAYACPSTTNLASISTAGTVTDLGAHGAGGAVTAYATDGVYLYLSGPAATATRKFKLSTSVFSAFSAQPFDSMTFLNNTLYGIRGGTLYSCDTSGIATSQFVFKDATGAAITDAMKVIGYGGKVLILRPVGPSNGAELWQYDGVATSKLAEFPANFAPDNFCVAQGIVFLIGVEDKQSKNRQAIWYWANGTIGRLWANQTSQTANGRSSLSPSAICAFGNGIVFVDRIWRSGVNQVAKVRYYDLSTGALSSLFDTSGVSNLVTRKYSLSSAGDFLYVHMSDTGTGAAKTGLIFDSATYPSTAVVTTSLFHFDSSLPKVFRGVLLDWDPASDGDGGSVDISYRVGDVDGTYTSLQAGAVAGTEYLLSGVTGRNISLQITLNKGTSTSGPKLKRIYVRAVPQLQTKQTRSYNLDLTATQSLPTQLQDGTNQALTGHEQASNLITAITSTSPISITDRFGTYTGILEPDQCRILELHSDGDTTPATSGQFVASLFAREV